MAAAYGECMRITFDSEKRAKTLSERGLDFARASEVFEGRNFTAADLRGYDEPRFITMGTLDQRLVVLVWTPRGSGRRIISMRKANEREQARFRSHLGRR